MMRQRFALRVLALTTAVTIAGCLGDSPVAPTIENATFAPSLGIDLDDFTRLGSGLYYRDIVVGTGAQATVGTLVSVRYSGSLTNAFVFDSGGASRTPVDFTIGEGGLIAGFEEGTFGMRVGGTRQIIIPPHLGYGSQPRTGIPANSILVFTLELLSAD